MSAYRVGWWAVVLSSGVLGLGAAVVLLQAGVLVLFSLCGATGVLVTGLVATPAAEPAPWWRSRGAWGVASRWGTAGGAVAGWAALLGPISLLGAVLLAGASPRVLLSWRGWLRSLLHPTSAQLDALARSVAGTNPTHLPFGQPLDDLRLLTDSQLDQVWRDSQGGVVSPAGRRALVRSVELRGRYLDELERRQPALLKAWLASEARDPGPSLPDPTPSRPESPTIDWDRLIGGQATDR